MKKFTNKIEKVLDGFFHFLLLLSGEEKPEEVSIDHIL